MEQQQPMKARGSRLEVFQGIARRTTGGLTKDDLFQRDGLVLSKRASESSKRVMASRKQPVSVKKLTKEYEEKITIEEPPTDEPTTNKPKRKRKAKKQ